MQKGLWLLLFIILSGQTYANLKTGIDGHAAGDVIAVMRDEEVAAYCNFDKSILMTARVVMCVYNGNKNPVS